MGVEALAIGALVGGGLGGITGYQQKKQSEREADIVESNAEQKAQLMEREAEQLKQRQKSKYLASGLDLSGSPLLLLEDTLTRGKEQAERVREVGYKTAKSLKKSGRNAFISSILQGTTGGIKMGSSFGG